MLLKFFVDLFRRIDERPQDVFRVAFVRFQLRQFRTDLLPFAAEFVAGDAA